MQNKNVVSFIKKILLYIFLVLFILIFFIHPKKKNIKPMKYITKELNKDNKYGLFLSSFRAEVMGDYFTLNNFYDQAMIQNKKDFLNKSFILKYNKNQKEEALIEAKKERDLDPSNIIPAIYLSFDEFKNKNYSSSISILDGVKNKTDTFIIKLFKSWVLMAQNKNDEALDLLETEINNRAFDKIVLMHLAAQAELAGDNQYAEELYTEALYEQLNLFDIENIASFYIRQGRKQKAIQILSDYYKSSPTSTSAFSLLKKIEDSNYIPTSIQTIEQGMAKAIFDISNIIISIFPGSTDLYLMHINMVLELSPNLYIAQLMKAEIYLKHNKEEEYLEIINSIPKDNYLHIISKINYASHLVFQNENLSNSARIYKDLLKENPTISQLYINLGNYYKDQNNYKTAYDYYSDGIEKGGNDTMISYLYFLRSVVNDTLENPEEVIKDLEESIKLNSKNPVVLNYYGYYLVNNNKDLERGFELVKQALRYDPINPHYLDSYGWAYYKLGKTEEALSMLEYAKSISPKNPVIINHLGDIYHSTGRTREAIYEWEKALAYIDKNGESEETENLTSKDILKKINKYQLKD